MKSKEDLNSELAAMNEAVTAAVRKRAEFLDENQHVFSPFAIGETVVRADSGEHTVVTAHYRYWTGRNELLDDSFSVHCRFGNGDNTSRYAGLHPYVSKRDYDARTNRFIRVLQSLAGSKP